MSKILHLEAGQKTPELLFVPEEGFLLIRGKCIPENPKSFFEPLFTAIQLYGKNPASNTRITLRLKYYNTSSAKCLVDVMKFLEELHSAGRTSMEVKWQYAEDDTDMAESGEDFKMILKVPFQIEKVIEEE